MLSERRKRVLDLVRRFVWWAVLAVLLFTSRARSDGFDEVHDASGSSPAVVPPPSAVCAPGASPPVATEAQAAPSPRTSSEHAATALGTTTAPTEPTDPPLDVLLSEDEPRAAFALAEEAAYQLDQARVRLRASQSRYTLARVDYDRLAQRIDELAAALRHTFRPDLSNPASIAPPARPIQVDGSFWRLESPNP